MTPMASGRDSSLCPPPHFRRTLSRPLYHPLFPALSLSCPLSRTHAHRELSSFDSCHKFSTFCHIPVDSPERTTMLQSECLGIVEQTVLIALFAAILLRPPSNATHFLHIHIHWLLATVRHLPRNDFPIAHTTWRP